MPHPSTRVPHRVYGSAASGNCHKVKLALDLLHIPYRWHEVDVVGGATREAEFLRINPNGQVPVLQLDEHSFLPESNAILCYLADGTELWPGDRLQRAQVLGWMFFEQNEHEPNIASARFLRVFARQPDHPRLPLLMERGERALAKMQSHLATQPFFAAQRFSIADIALFAYTHRAADGGFDLSRYPAVQAWLDRCRAAGATDMPDPAG